MTSVVLPSTTGIVSREEHFIRKIHPATTTHVQGQRLYALTKLLHAESINAPALLSYLDRPGLRGQKSALITYWNDVGVSTGLCWQKAGEELRKVHEIPLHKVLQLNLPHLESSETFEELFLILRSEKHSKTTLIDWLEKAAHRALASIPEAEHLCLVHDDFWPKNIVRDEAGKTWILDWDNAGIASPAYDLAFVARAVAGKIITEQEKDAFVLGYGSPLPAIELAHAYGSLHRIRWVVSLLQRAQAQDSIAGELLTQEEGLWTSAAGPLMNL